jgi:hypothetical protein
VQDPLLKDCVALAASLLTGEGKSLEAQQRDFVQRTWEPGQRQRQVNSEANILAAPAAPYRGHGVTPLTYYYH